MLYVTVAVLNYSIVQSYIGTVAGYRLSQEWGGEVKIGALHVMPWDHVILNNVLLVSPDNDTILDVESARLQFNHFPFKNRKTGDNNTRQSQLKFKSVYLGHGYYHLGITFDPKTNRNVTNLEYILQHYPIEGKINYKFAVDVETVILNHVHYRMDLPPVHKEEYENPYEENTAPSVDIEHMEFYDIQARIKNVHVVNSDVACRVVKFSVEEKSGFVVDNLKGHVHVNEYGIRVLEFEARTPKSKIQADVVISYDGWEVMQDYAHTVSHDIQIKEGTSVAMSDVAYWVPALQGINAQIDAEADIKGRLDSLDIAMLSARCGEWTRVLLSGNTMGLPDIENTVVDLNIERLRTDQKDIADLNLPPAMAKPIGRIAKQMGDVDLTMRVKGGLNATTTADLYLDSRMGDMIASATARPLPNGGLRFNADMSSNSIDLHLLGSNWLSRSGFTLNASGIMRNTRKPSTLNAEIQGELTGSVVQGQRLAPLSFEGEIRNGIAQAHIISTDSLARFTLNADADLDSEEKHYHASANIERLDVHAFKLMAERFAPLKGTVGIDMQGNSIDEMHGGINATNVALGDISLNSCQLTVAQTDGHKEITLDADPVNATIRGKFDYKHLPLLVNGVIREILPSDFTAKLDTTAAMPEANIDFSIRWIDDGDFMAMLTDKVRVAKGSRLIGSLSNRELLKVVLRSDSVRFGSTLFESIGLNSRRSISGYIVEAESQDITLGTLPLMTRAEFTVNSSPERAMLELAWGDDDATSQGVIGLRLRDGNITVTKPSFSIRDHDWTLDIDNCKINVDDGIKLNADNISLASDEQQIGASLKLEGADNDHVVLDFNRFSVKLLSDLFLQGSNIEVSGLADGRFNLYGIEDMPYFNLALAIDSCIVNRQPLGRVTARSNGNAETKTMNVEISGDQIYANGWIGLGQKDPELNLAAEFNSFELGLIAPLMKQFASRFEGQLHGYFDITGTTAKPMVSGEAFVDNGVLGIEATGVTYRFHDTISFDNDIVALDNFRLNDKYDNTAYINGTIGFADISHPALNLAIATDNIMVLDKRNGNDYYGTLFTSANGSVAGSLNALNIDIQATTRPGSVVNVPVNNQRQVKAQNYITFVGDQPLSRATSIRKRETTTNLKLELDLAITPDVQLNLPMSFTEIDVNVGAMGMGDMHLSMDGAQQPNVMGSYEISHGTMRVNIAALIDKNFTLESGSNLSFQGSVPDTRFDLKAVYSQRANLSTLTGSLSAIDNTQKYIQVDNIIAVAGTLKEPTLSFDMRLPSADQSVEDEVFAYIDRNSERDMLNQTLSLLLTGQFYNISGTMQGTTAAASGIGSIASTLGTAMADMVEFVDINVDYKAATEITKEQLDIGISKDWGRWYLESTLGYGGESRDLEMNSNQTAVIDALVGYRLSPLVHLFAYNRTNTNDYTRMDLPYKQGVGLKLTKDFDRWSELFIPSKGRKKKNEEK